MEAGDQQAQKQLQLQKQMQLKRQQLEKQKMQMKQQGKLPVNTESLDAKVAKTIVEKLSTLSERGDFWHPDPEKDRKLGGPGANARAREDRADASEPKKDYSKTTKPGESYMDFAKRKQAETSKSSTKYPPEIQKRLDAAKAKRQQATRSESAVPGQPAERLGAVTAIPSDEREAAKQRTLAKAAALRKKREEQKEEVEHVDEALTGERYKKAIKKPGARAYSRMVSADPAKRATRGGRGGESDFGAGDRGSGNRARRRAGTYQEEEFAIDEGAAGDVASRAQKLANQRKGQTPERKKMYQGLADRAAARERGPFKGGTSRQGMTPAERTRSREAAAYQADVHGGSATYGKGSLPKGKKLERQRARGVSEKFELWLDEAMTNYEKNRKRAAQRAAARNAARDQGKTGAVPGVGYVTPRRERETWTDESGKTRHAKGL